MHAYTSHTCEIKNTHYIWEKISLLYIICILYKYSLLTSLILKLIYTQDITDNKTYMAKKTHFEWSVTEFMLFVALFLNKW